MRVDHPTKIIVVSVLEGIIPMSSPTIRGCIDKILRKTISLKLKFEVWKLLIVNMNVLK
jgi:hypothetical protein